VGVGGDRDQAQRVTAPATGPDPDPAVCPICGPPLALGPGRVLRMRHSSAEDATGLRDLYHRLSRADLHRRFFTGAPPPAAFFERWAGVARAGGFGLVAELTDSAGRRLIGEAGYALLDDGDGELGIAVDPLHRGWLGPWLFAALLDHAADRGVPNLQAVVLSSNRSMLALARRKGFAVLGHPDPGVLRLTMSTGGRVPSWPQHHHRARVLVETDRTTWWAEDDLREAGYDLALCTGGCRSADRCPVLQGRPCPLVDGADAVVVDLAADDPRTLELIEAERLVHPGVRLIEVSELGAGGESRRRDPAELLDRLDEIVADPPRPDGRDGP